MKAPGFRNHPWNCCIVGAIRTISARARAKTTSDWVEIYIISLNTGLLFDTTIGPVPWLPNRARNFLWICPVVTFAGGECCAPQDSSPPPPAARRQGVVDLKFKIKRRTLTSESSSCVFADWWWRFRRHGGVHCEKFRVLMSFFKCSLVLTKNEFNQI